MSKKRSRELSLLKLSLTSLIRASVEVLESIAKYLTFPSTSDPVIAPVVMKATRRSRFILTVNVPTVSKLLERVEVALRTCPLSMSLIGDAFSPNLLTTSSRTSSAVASSTSLPKSPNEDASLSSLAMRRSRRAIFCDAVKCLIGYLLYER